MAMKNDYQIVFDKKAEKDLKKIGRNDRLKILGKIVKLKNEPHLGKKLKGGFKDCYSLRIWPYRVIYKIFSEKRIIVIIRIGHRQGVYV